TCSTVSPKSSAISSNGSPLFFKFNAYFSFSDSALARSTSRPFSIPSSIPSRRPSLIAVRRTLSASRLFFKLDSYNFISDSVKFAESLYPALSSAARIVCYLSDIKYKSKYPIIQKLRHFIQLFHMPKQVQPHIHIALNFILFLIKIRQDQ